MLKKIFILTILFVISTGSYAQQTREEIQKKQQELQKELNDLNSKLADIKNNKKISLSQLNMVQRKIKAREELISNINKEMRRLDDDIYLTQLEMNRLRKELDTLKQQYAKSLQFAYKNRSNYDYLNFLFSSQSFNDAVKRVAYLKSYRSFRETQAATINQTTNLLSQKAGQLTSRKTEKNVALGEQNKQLVVLEQDKKDKDQVVKNLKNREQDLGQEIRNREKMRQKLQQNLQVIIRREIEEARKREKERLAKLAEEEKRKRDAEIARIKAIGSNTKPTTEKPTADPKPKQVIDTENKGVVTGGGGDKNRSYSILESSSEGLSQSVNFENNRGRLPWPADQGNVTIHFGPYEVPGTKLKGVSDGIDIELPVGANVKCVADGEVSAVFDLGDQTIVIKHGKYFTTYSHLSTVNVTKGQTVKAGTNLGKAAAGDDGAGQLTFMVTNEKGTNLNPETWLRRR